MLYGELKDTKREGSGSEEIEKKSEVESNASRMTESCRRSKYVGNYKEVKRRGKTWKKQKTK